LGPSSATTRAPITMVPAAISLAPTAPALTGLLRSPICSPWGYGNRINARCSRRRLFP
jgi:hypothetical protein